MGRLTMVFRAIWNKMLGRTEDKYYRELLDLGYDEMVNMVGEVGTDLASVAQAEFRIRKLVSDAEQGATKWEQTAVQFLEKGKEDEAREALARKAQLAQQAEDLRVKLEQVAAKRQELEATKKQLDVEVANFQSTKEVMKAEHTAAKATAQIAETVTGIGGKAMNIGRTVGRLRESTEQLEARGEGIQALMSSGALKNALNPGQTPLDLSAAKMERDTQVEADLARLKKQLGPAETQEPAKTQ